MSNRGSYELAQAVKNSGKMGTGGKIGIAFAVIVFIVGIGILIAYAVNPDIFKSKKEGDVCEGNDVRGTYEIDEEGKCSLISCQAGWEVDGKTCIKSAPAPPPVVQMSPTRAYPPTPFPSVTTGDEVLDVSHTVTGAAYGNGTYRAQISSSLNQHWPAGFDVDALFDEGPGAPQAYADGNLPAYHTTGGTAAGDPTWLHFYLPQAIYLDRLEIFPRHHSAGETLNFSQNFSVYGIVREGGGPQQTELFNNAQVTVEFQKKIILRMTDTSKKFSEFKVVFVPKEDKGTIIQEMVFMGHEEV